MVRIKKRVNEIDLRPRPCGRVNKGDEKTGSFGRDLNNKLRFHGIDDRIAHAVHSAYTKHQHLLGGTETESFAQKKGYDVIVDHLNIVFPGEIDEVFNSSMTMWNGKNEIVRQCDRDTILKERNDYLDLNKQPYSQLDNCNKPCPLREQGLGTACPLGCVHEASLTFQIAELILIGEYRPVVLTTHSWEDEGGIPYQLELLQQAYGSICRSEFEWKGIGNRIPFILSRHEVKINRPNIDTKEKLNLNGRKIPVRTGGKSKSTHWAISIKVNPAWHMAYLAWQEDKKARYFGLQTNPKALIETGIIDAEVIDITSTVKAIAPAKPEEDDWKPKAYEFGVSKGLDADTLTEMINSAVNRESLWDQMVAAIKQLRANQQPDIIPVTEPVDTLLTESVDGEFAVFEEEGF